ncbi:calcium-binding mitochondrial carrier protein SCaMC-2-like [Oscarella lobularis]|uniref:calcium-binding mitochondrial carrier protein SCaMC-2-like n=1 Tax=Oscarella lobularis TaxID=121494 RepID=UPI0033139D08
MSKFKTLFEQLDVNKDGRIDAKELEDGLKRLGASRSGEQAKEILKRSDSNTDGQLDLAEFSKYLDAHERKLDLVFKDIDTNKDGRLDRAEITSALGRLGLKVSDAEVEKLLKHMDKDGSLTITWDEWREYHLLKPANDLREMFRNWRHAAAIDIGESLLIPDDFLEDEKTSGLWWKQLVAGAGAGAVSRTSTAPLDRLKILLQVQGGSGGQRLGIWSGFTQMIQEGGYRSLWRGNGVNVVKIAPETAMKFFAYEQIKKLFRENSSTDLRVSERFAAGSLAGVVSQTAIYPMEVLKTRLALRKTGQYKGIADAARSILQTEGIRSFYRGLLPNLLGVIPYAGVDLTIYETLKNRWVHRHSASDRPSVTVLLLCGAISCTCGQLASYPLALVRTRLQAQTNTLRGGAKGQGMVALFQNILATEGPVGLYRGIGPNFIKVVPAVSISYVVYENLKTWLGVPTI